MPVRLRKRLTYPVRSVGSDCILFKCRRKKLERYCESSYNRQRRPWDRLYWRSWRSNPKVSRRWLCLGQVERDLCLCLLNMVNVSEDTGSLSGVKPGREPRYRQRLTTTSLILRSRCETQGLTQNIWIFEMHSKTYRVRLTSVLWGTANYQSVYISLDILIKCYENHLVFFNPIRTRLF